MYFEWLCSHYVPYHYSPITTILFPPKPPPKPLILVFAHTVSPEILGSCMKIGLKCTRLVNVFFIVCKSNNQHIYNILLTSALFIVAEYSLVVFQGYFSPYLQSKA